jgi:hypothetical protein
MSAIGAPGTRKPAAFRNVNLRIRCTFNVSHFPTSFLTPHSLNARPHSTTSLKFSYRRLSEAKQRSTLEEPRAGS